jgi:hypothetical protein
MSDRLNFWNEYIPTKKDSASYSLVKTSRKSNEKKTTRKSGSKKVASRRSRKKSSVRIPIDRGALAWFDAKNGEIVDYHISTPTKKRRALLRRLVTDKNMDALTVFRAIIARRTLGKNRLSEQQISTLTSDADYVKKKYYNTDFWQK